MYGLTNAAIAQKLEAQEGAAACAGYVPVKERKKKSHIPQGDGEEEDDSFEFDSASEASPSEASLASEEEESAMLELSEEEALEKEALLEVQALSARRRSRSAKADKSKRLSAQSKEVTKAEETVVKMLKCAMVGKDSCLRVRCRRCEGGLEAEDSLMWACGAGLRRSDNVIRVEYPASLFTVKKERVEAKKESVEVKKERTSGKKESVEVKKERTSGKKESVEVKKERTSGKKESVEVKKERAGRRGRGEELLSAEAMFDIDMSGTYRTGFEAVGRSEGRVSVKACSSSLLKPKAELVLHKMR